MNETWIWIKGWLLGIQHAEEVAIEHVELAAPWAKGSGHYFWVWFGVVCLLAISFLFYLKFQQRGSAAARGALAACRGLLLVLVFLTLADPIVRLHNTYQLPPLLYVLFDGTQSMAIKDDFSTDETTALNEAVGLPTGEKQKRARIDYVKALVARDDEQNLLRRLGQQKHARLEAFVFEGANTSQLKPLKLSASGEQIDPGYLADQLTANGQVTAIGNVMDQLNGQLDKGQLAGVVMVSDYAHNAGRAPTGESMYGGSSPVARLNVPVYTVGVGATEVNNLSVDIRPDVRMKRAERSNITVKWEQTGLTGQTVTLKVTGRWTGGPEENSTVNVGEKTVVLDDAVGAVTLPFTPEGAGQLELTAKFDPLDGEVSADDNISRKQVRVVDDHLNLMYVAYEPDWEWRFIKEVFHRDKLVGIEGFHTYLRSSDPKVRQHNELFLPTPTPKRSEFMANDIIFLGDMPGAALSQRFCELTKEFVGDFGGGLVVIAGPRFGPGELIGTPLEEMLPVKLSAGVKIRDQREFLLELTPFGQSKDFMRLGEGTSDDAGDAENLAAWRNLGPLPWYQPVRGVKDLAEVLAEHPWDICPLGDDRQPLIVRWKFGKGEVIYIGFNEMWRMRRKHGELYYRQFWSQLMNYLALSQALGKQKRFDVRTDRDKYHVDDRVTVIVEAFDENFERLRPERLEDGRLEAKLYAPGGEEVDPPIHLAPLREGEYEASIRADTAGEWRMRVKDPIEGTYRDVRFQVASLSAEQRRPERDADLQQRIALASGGGSYDLAHVNDLVDDLDLKPHTVIEEKIKPLWATPLWFILVIGLMLGEWFSRKMMNMT